MSSVRANQKPERPVSTRPLSGISVGSTTSKTEIRSLATSSSRPSSRAKSSRTFPVPTWTASGMDGVLLSFESAQPFEDGVDVTGEGGEVEHVVEVDAAGDLPVCTDELAEILLF